MILLVGIAAALLSVPLAGGTFRGLDRDELRAPGWMASAMVVQLFLGSLHDTWVPRVLFVATMLLAGVFVARNWGRPGMRLMAVGGLANLVAIVSNRGVMPAWSWAWRVSGAPAIPLERFANARPADGAPLLVLGDVVPFPSGIPGSAPFSIGDALLVAGFVVLIHHLCGSAWAVRGAKRRGAPPPELWRWRHLRATRTGGPAPTV